MVQLHSLCCVKLRTTHIVIYFIFVFYGAFSPINFLSLCVKDVCKMYKMKMNNVLIDVEIFSLCHKETLFQAELHLLLNGNGGPLCSQIKL